MLVLTRIFTGVTMVTLNHLAAYLLGNIANTTGFLANLTTLGTLDTYYAVQDKGFLANLATLGILDTAHAVQDKGFLSEVSSEFSQPYMYADGILSVVKSSKVIDTVTVYITNRYGYTDTEYIASDGTNYAHASTLRMSIIDLRFKLSDRDVGWLRDKKLNDTLSFEDAVLAYRLVTGACSGGVQGFLREHKEQANYSISEIIEYTRGQYQHDQFAGFFQNK